MDDSRASTGDTLSNYLAFFPCYIVFERCFVKKRPFDLVERWKKKHFHSWLKWNKPCELIDRPSQEGFMYCTSYTTTEKMKWNVYITFDQVLQIQMTDAFESMLILMSLIDLSEKCWNLQSLLCDPFAIFVLATLLEDLGLREPEYVLLLSFLKLYWTTKHPSKLLWGTFDLGWFWCPTEGKGVHLRTLMFCSVFVQVEPSDQICSNVCLK